MPAVVTMVSARVPRERHQVVVEGFADAMRAGMPERRHTSLLRGDDDVWRIVTLWRNRADLDAYLAGSAQPFASRLLRAAGGEPEVEIFELVLDTGTTWWT